MNKIKAQKLIKRKITRLKACPFCGKTPKIEAYCDNNYSSHGSIGHFSIRKPCCKVTGSGQTELFYCNNFEKEDYRLWWKMTSRMIDEWNKRI